MQGDNKGNRKTPEVAEESNWTQVKITKTFLTFKKNLKYNKQLNVVRFLQKNLQI